MLIIKMLKRITGYNQEELANYLGVSRASINLWDNSDGKMTTYQKNIISNKLDIPIEYFDNDLVNNFDKSKELYQIIQTRWNLQNQSIKPIDTEEDLLNAIEYQINKTEETVSEYEIIEGLVNGYNPYTGEVFDENHILNDDNIHMLLLNIKNKYFKYGNKNLTIDDLSNTQYKLFEELRKWRKDMTVKEGFFSAYMVFTDKELINIITSNTNKKEDLLSVKGIANKKYDKYGDDIFYILKTGSYDFNINV